MGEKGHLIRWIEAVVRDRRLSREQVEMLVLIGMSGKGTYGLECRVDAGYLARELGVNAATIWRWVGRATELGYLVRTQKPAPAKGGERAGRPALYQCTLPGEVTSRTDTPTGATRTSRTTPRGGATRTSRTDTPAGAIRQVADRLAMPRD